MAHSACATGTKPTANAPSPVKATKHSVARDFPIAGILMHPYPCVVMRGGMRLAVGAQLGTASLVRIEADRLILRDGHTTFEWKP